MSKLIDELRREHSALADILEKVNDLGIGTEEGRKLLMSAKNGLIAHLQKEDSRLYPALNRAAEQDSTLRHTLTTFAKDMDEISKAALTFFDKYSKSQSGHEFAKDFGRLYATLKQRIYREENMIYKKYDELERG